MATYAEVRTAWNAAAARLGVDPEVLAHRHDRARTVRQWVVDAGRLPVEQRSQQYRLAVWGLQDIK